MKKLALSMQASETLALGIFLTLAGGFQDAYSYNCRGHVFANAQTGNIVLLGQNLAQGNWGAALRYLIPILAFLAGVYVTEWIRHLFQDRQQLHWRQIVVLIQTASLGAVGFFPQEWNMAANLLLSFSCAMQVDSFRKIRGLPCATTMCIGNMRSGTELLSRYHITKDPTLLKKGLHYYLIILVFASGAAIGAMVTPFLGEKAIWIAASLLLTGFFIMFLKEKKEGEEIL